MKTKAALLLALVWIFSAAQAEAPRPPPDILNIVQFTRGDAPLDVRKFRQILDFTYGNILPAEEDLCAFDRPPGFAPVDYWNLDERGVGVLDQLTSEQIDGAQAAAAARNALVYETFPDWASEKFKAFVANANIMQVVGGFVRPGDTRAIYIAFGKIAGPYVKPEGQLNFVFKNEGDYVIERDGANTKGYLPVALCALLRTPRMH